MDNLLYALYLVHIYIYVVLLKIPSMLQAELRSKDAQNSDLQENVKSQQAEAAKAKEEPMQALAGMEKLKESFNQDRAEWETEKAGLTKRVVDAEEALNSVVEELASLKRQINAMTSVIFGKYSCQNFLNNHL